MKNPHALRNERRISIHGRDHFSQKHSLGIKCAARYEAIRGRHSLERVQNIHVLGRNETEKKRREIGREMEKERERVGLSLITKVEELTRLMWLFYLNIVKMLMARPSITPNPRRSHHQHQTGLMIGAK